VSLTFALAHSLNAATVALSKELYLKDIAANAKKMGISTKLEVTPSMVLGTNSVKVLDMAAAYAVLANGGYQVAPYAINEISTRDGRQIYVRKSIIPEKILSSSVVCDMSIMLENVINQGTGKRAKLPIFAVGKTGTTQNYRDAWFIGWTNKYIAAVWVGNDNDKPMNKVGGGGLPAQIWHDIMLTTVKDTPSGAPQYLPANQPQKNIGSYVGNKEAAKPAAAAAANTDDDDTYDAIGALIELTD
jgi:penicillin-binding protein 1A